MKGLLQTASTITPQLCQIEVALRTQIKPLCGYSCCQQRAALTKKNQTHRQQDAQNKLHVPHSSCTSHDSSSTFHLRGSPARGSTIGSTSPAGFAPSQNDKSSPCCRQAVSPPPDSQPIAPLTQHQQLTFCQHISVLITSNWSTGL